MAADMNSQAERRREFGAFLLLTVALAPLVTAVLVGGMGFSIWIYQMIAGPPGS